MVFNPLAEASANGKGSSNRKIREQTLDQVHQFLSKSATCAPFDPERDVGFVFAVLRQDGQWRRGASTGLPPPALAHFDGALRGQSTPSESHFSRTTDFHNSQESRTRSLVFDDASMVQVRSSQKRKREQREVSFISIKGEDSEDEEDSDTLSSDSQASPSNKLDTLAPEETITISFADEKVTNDFFRKKLAVIQQLSLKCILKQWIKTIEPRKQSKYAYVAGNRPPWWPQHLTYKEPDHLHSYDRFELALAILSIYKDNNLTSQLDESSREHAQRGTALNGWTEMLKNSTRDLPLQFDNDGRREERRTQRKQVLRDIYDAAFVLEEIYYDERDETFTKTYLKATTEIKRSKKGNKKAKFENDTSNGQSARGSTARPIGHIPMNVDEPAGNLMTWSHNATACTSEFPTPTQALRSIEPSTRRTNQQRPLLPLQPAANLRNSTYNHQSYPLSRETSTNSHSSAPGSIYHASVMAPGQGLAGTSISTSHPRSFTLDIDPSMQAPTLQYNDVMTDTQSYSVTVRDPQQQPWVHPVSPSQNTNTVGPQTRRSVSYQPQYAASPMSLSPMSHTDFSSFTASPSLEVSSAARYHPQMEQIPPQYISNTMTYDHTQQSSQPGYEFDQMNPMFFAPAPPRHDSKQEQDQDASMAYAMPTNINMNYDHY